MLRHQPPSGWLLRDHDVLATLEIACSTGDRMRGLLGRDGIEGAILLRSVKSVHTFGMRFPIDVAFCDRDMVVVRTACLPPNRVTLPVMRASCVVEAESGAFERWKLRVGDRLDVKE